MSNATEPSQITTRVMPTPWFFSSNIMLPLSSYINSVNINVSSEGKAIDILCNSLNDCFMRLGRHSPYQSTKNLTYLMVSNYLVHVLTIPLLSVCVVLVFFALLLVYRLHLNIFLFLFSSYLPSS